MASVIFKGDKVASLKDKIQIGKDDSDSAQLIKSVFDPTLFAVSANPGSILYNPDNGRLYKKLDSGSTTNWKQIREDQESYIANGDFDFNIEGWSLYLDPTPGAVPTTGGVGAGATNALTRSTVAGEQLYANRAVGRYDKTGNTQGEGFTTTLAISPEAQGKRVFVSFGFAFPIGTYQDNMQVFAYDIDNSTLIGALSNDDGGFIGNTSGTIASGGASKFVGSFQCPTSCTSVRLIFHITDTDATNWSIALGKVRAFPDVIVPGAIVTEWENFTPTTSLTTNATNTGKKRRVGDTMEVMISTEFTGVNTEGAYNVTVPDGLTIDTSKLNSIAVGDDKLGDFTIFDNSGGRLLGEARYNTTTEIIFGVVDEAAASTHYLVTPNTAVGQPITIASGDRFLAYLKIPIAGWSAGASLSTTETFFSTGVVQAARSTSQTVNTTDTDIIFDSVEIDVTDSYNNSTGVFTAPKTANYLVSMNARVNVGVSAATQHIIWFNINGANGNGLCASTDVVANTSYHYNPVSILPLDKGDDLKIVMLSATNSSTLIAGQNRLSITEVPDFSTFSVFGSTELLSVSSGGLVAYGITAGQYGDHASLLLGAGEWDIEVKAQHNNNGAVTVQNIAIGLSTTAGNSTTGLVQGENHFFFRNEGTSGYIYSNSFQVKGEIVTSPTTYYFKGSTPLANTNLEIAYQMQARRVK